MELFYFLLILYSCQSIHFLAIFWPSCDVWLLLCHVSLWHGGRRSNSRNIHHSWWKYVSILRSTENRVLSFFFPCPGSEQTVWQYRVNISALSSSDHSNETSKNHMLETHNQVLTCSCCFTSFPLIDYHMETKTDLMMTHSKCYSWQH